MVFWFKLSSDYNQVWINFPFPAMSSCPSKSSTWGKVDGDIWASTSATLSTDYVLQPPTHSTIFGRPRRKIATVNVAMPLVVAPKRWSYSRTVRDVHRWSSWSCDHGRPKTNFWKCQTFRMKTLQSDSSAANKNTALVHMMPLPNPNTQRGLACW